MLSIERKSLESLAALALFTFAFLGSEFFFDRRMGTLLPAEGVVGAQALILGASVVAFSPSQRSRNFRAHGHGHPSPKPQAPSRASSPSSCSMTPPHCKLPDAQASSFWGAQERKPIGTWHAHSREAHHSLRAQVPPMQQAFCCNSRTTNSFPRAHGKSPCCVQEPRR